MTTPEANRTAADLVPEAVARLREVVEPHIEHARGADLETSDAAVALYDAWAAQAHERGDVEAELLHRRIAVLYRATSLAARAAEIIAKGGADPMEDR